MNEGEISQMKQREYWLDYLRAFACIWTAAAHLLMSLRDAQLMQNSWLLTVFVDMSYNVPAFIFFFCSGYLFQTHKRKLTTGLWAYRIENCLNYIIVYVLFSSITYAIKAVFSSDVNASVQYDYWDILLRYPIGQMWYLYAISSVILFVCVMRSDKSACIILGAALLAKVLVDPAGFGIWFSVPVNYLFRNMIWFVLGQLFAYRNIKLGMGISLLLAALHVGFFVFGCNISSSILTLLGVLASAGIIYNLTKNKTKMTGPMKYVAKYMLQIYLLHTIFAAGTRILLLKIGVTQLWIHLILGAVFSFVPPILCSMIAERSKYLNIFFFPVKTIKELGRK